MTIPEIDDLSQCNGNENWSCSDALSFRIMGAILERRCKSSWLEVVKKTPQLRSIVFSTCVISVTYDIDLHFVISGYFALSATYSHLCWCSLACDIGFVPCVWCSIINKQVNWVGIRSRRTEKMWRDWNRSQLGGACVQARWTIDDMVEIIAYCKCKFCHACLLCRTEVAN